MKEKNIEAIQNLSLFCHVSGIITVFLGLVVIFMDLINKDFGHVQVGIFILTVGYAFMKISSKIMAIVTDEQSN